MKLVGRVEKILGIKQKNLQLFLFSTPNKEALNKSKQYPGSVLCAASPSMITLNAPLELIGEFDSDIFYVEERIYKYIDSKSTLDFLVSICKGSGVGKTLLSKVVSKYKDKIFNFESPIIFERQLIKDFPTLKTTKIKIIVNAVYGSNALLLKLEKLFANTNIDYNQILSIYSKYEKDSIKHIMENPYNVGLEFNMPYYVADSVAHSLKINKYDSRRINGLLHYYIEKEASNGHTYVNTVECVKAVSKMSERSIYKTPIFAIQISNEIFKSNKYVLDEDKVSLKKYYIAEKIIASRLKILNSYKSKINISKDDIKKVEDKLNFTFGKDQKRAFHLLEGNRVNILTGGPGTGKTSIIRGIIELYLSYFPGHVIKFCAPTGRAAKRLAESSGYPAMTIHKLLEYKPFDNGESIHKNEANPIKADFIVVDECSMIDVELMAMLLLAVKNETRILFVGDEHQLPSIGPGNILHDLIEKGTYPVYKLTENFRQSETGHIKDNSDLILDKELPKDYEDFRIFRADNEDKAFNGLKFLFNKYYDINNPFKTQVIEPSKKGIAGTYKMNQYAHQYVHNNFKDLDPGIMMGDKVIFTRTEYESGYVNGDIGIVTHLNSEDITIYNDMEEITVPRSAINDLSFAYSYTIHKSQGSENDIVIIYLPDEMSHMMTNALLYTAVTRAKEKIIIIYTGDALNKCIHNTKDVERNTRLKEFL